MHVNNTRVRGSHANPVRKRFTTTGAIAMAAAILLTIGVLGAGSGPALSGPAPSGADMADPSTGQRVVTGAEKLVASGFAALDGKRVALITNQTGRVGQDHLADLLWQAENVDLVAILGPEHGFRGTIEAGKTVKDGVDTKTGIPVFSLYGSTRKPTRRMLKGVDMLVFDIQDIGARFYTYISTMGLAMQAAAEAGIPFVVLDRPNPLGGNYVSGFVLEDRHRSFVGQYPIPIVHGLTVAELAHMIKAEGWLDGLEPLDLQLMPMDGWRRDMRWLETGQPWMPTSPNIPTFTSALVYPGIGVIGETAIVNEGRGTPEPFTVFGAPWLDARTMATRLNRLGLPGARFEAVRYRPRSIPKVAKNPLFVGRTINGVAIKVTDVARYQPLEVGIHALAMIMAQARAKGVSPLFKKRRMFDLISGTTRLRRMLMSGATGQAIVSAWRAEVAKFTERSAAYHLYP